ncbi:hypothetical protein [Microvirga vignae]|uniref:hypothetical protein n=1 Tax=Microvirga vignae TaxID=1225564 RepID=UPI00063FE033|nr:hypothetical protein [Microvirga vignae]
MARPRIFLLLVQALLGLLFLAWLPAIGDAGLESSFPFQLEETLSLSDPPDNGETDPETCRDGRSGGEGGPDALILPNILCRPILGVNGQGIRQVVPDAVLPAHLLGAPHATGPPGLWL